MFYINGTFTAAELMKRLELFMGELSIMHEDEIISIIAEAKSTEECFEILCSDRDFDLDEPSPEAEAVKKTPVHLLHDYWIDTFDDAVSSDSFFEDLDRQKRYFWKDKIRPQIIDKEEEEDNEL